MSSIDRKDSPGECKAADLFLKGVFERGKIFSHAPIGKKKYKKRTSNEPTLVKVEGLTKLNNLTGQKTDVHPSQPCRKFDIINGK